MSKITIANPAVNVSCARCVDEMMKMMMKMMIVMRMMMRMMMMMIQTIYVCIMTS